MEVREDNRVQVDYPLPRERLRYLFVWPRVHKHCGAAIGHENGVTLPHVQHANPCGLQEAHAQQKGNGSPCQNRSATQEDAFARSGPSPVERHACGAENREHGDHACLHGQACQGEPRQGTEHHAERLGDAFGGGKDREL